jgi:hypothetical protein
MGKVISKLEWSTFLGKAEVVVLFMLNLISAFYLLYLFFLGVFCSEFYVSCDSLPPEKGLAW